MDYALISHKNPAADWDEFRAHPRRKPKLKKNKTLAGSRSPKKTAADVWGLIRALMNFLTLVVLGAACGYGGYTAYAYLTTSPRFAVAEVQVQGTVKLPKAEILELIGPVAGSNIFLLDIEDVSARLAGHPWVRSASVRKAYPQTLEVNVVERTPYARIEMDRVYVMDNYGVLLAADGPEYQDLPLIAKPYGEKPALGENAAGEGVIRAFQIMHYLNRLPLFQHNPVGAARVDRAHRVQFQTRDSGMTIVMPLDTISESFEHLLIVLDILKQKAATLERIDLSFRDQVVIRDPKSTSPSNHFS